LRARNIRQRFERNRDATGTARDPFRGDDHGSCLAAFDDASDSHPGRVRKLSKRHRRNVGNIKGNQAKPAGLTPLEAAQEAGPGPYADLLDSERLVGNLHRAYAELDGAAPGAPIDLFAALIDMVAYNGGKPLRCLA